MGKPLINIVVLSAAIVLSARGIFKNQQMIKEFGHADSSSIPADLTKEQSEMAGYLPQKSKVFYWTQDRGIVLECKIASLNYHFYPLNFIFRDEERMDECGFIICKSSEIAQLQEILRKKSELFIFDRTIGDYTIFKKLIIE
jgi:hypothetical protein